MVSSIDTHGGLIDSTQKLIEEVRAVEEGGWPWVTMVTPLQVAEKSTSCVCTCACVCVTIGVDSQLLVWHIGTIISHSCYNYVHYAKYEFRFVCVYICMCVFVGVSVCGRVSM